MNKGLILIFCCVSMFGWSQTRLNMPYSRFGIGEIYEKTSSGVTAQGGTGLAFQSASVVNSANPASYIGYDSLSCLFDAAFSFKNHTLSSTSVSSQKGSTMMFDYIAFGLPITRWWKTTVGFQPFSSMNYNILESKQLDSLPYAVFYKGGGGVNDIYWGNAFRLYKGWSIGFNISFLFGTYTRSRSEEWEDERMFNFKKENANKVSGAYLTIGSQYFIPIKEKGKLGLGVIYTPPIPIFSKSTEEIYTYVGSEAINGHIDTLYPSSSKHKHSMPTILGGGLSWSANRYFVGADVSWKNWSAYSIDGKTDSLADALKISLGGNITPNPSGKAYFSRITYSLGGNYEKTNLKINNTQLHKYGINLGLFFPIKRSRTGLGIIFEYGSLGTTQNNLIKENYFKVTLNLRIHERWYQRIKYE